MSSDATHADDLSSTGRTAGDRPGSPGSCSSGVALVATYVVVRLVGRIDWAAVWDALSQLTWWQPIVLLAVVVVRQVLNALPLTFYIRGVSAYRATINDLGAILMSVVAPPPSDLALRVTMFTSWGVLGREGRGRHGDEHPDLLHRALLGAGRRVRAAAGHRAAARPALARAGAASRSR